MKPFLIVGAGFSGAVLAREIAVHLRHPVLVLDERPHVGGNCHTERDPSTNVLVHKYGPHIFHTDREDVWNYVRQFDDFGPFVNRVKASISRGIFSLPVNLHTINQFFGVRLGPEEARKLLAGKADKSIGEPQNFEEQALKFLGPELYYAFFHGYTKKQWGCDPRELPASILKRLPVRFNYDDNYYYSSYQGIPRAGYTHIVGGILNHPLITVKLGTRFEKWMMKDHEATFYTGPLDGYFNYGHGRLGYRTVFWDRLECEGDYQGTALINYPDLKEPHTRIIEHKHFMPWETHDKTIVFTEFSKETTADDVAYYPKRLKSDLDLLARYKEMARQESQDQSVFFLGRLATYRYLDMHQVIGEALDFSRQFFSWRLDPKKTICPVFSGP